MFDLWIEKARSRMFGKLEEELVEAEEKGESRKVESFLVRSAPRILASILIFLGMLWIFTKLADKYGIERVMIGIGIIIILNLRGINKTLNRV